MDALNNILVQSFLDDMAEVGTLSWTAGAFVFALLSVSMWGGSPIPFGGIIGAVMALNLLFAAAVTAWWDYYGREKYGQTSILDIGREKGRDL